MAVKVNGNRGLNFVGSFDISEIENNSRRVLDLLDTVKRQASAANKGGSTDTSYRTEQLAIQKALGDSRVALQKLKEAQQVQRTEQEKSKAVIAAERAELEKLKAVEQELNNQYKAGKVALAEYTLEQRKIAAAQREALLAQKEAERTLREQTKLQKEQEKQAERNRKALERESSEYHKLSTALGNVRKEAKDVLAEMFRLSKEGLSASDAYRQLEIRSKALTSQTTILDTGIKRIDASLGLHQRNVGNYGSAIANLSPMFASIDQSLNLFGTSIDDLATRPDPFKALGASLMAFGRASVAFLATPVGAIIALLGGLYALISSNKQTVLDFDAGLKGVSKTTGLAGEELSALGDSVVKLSSKLETVSSKKLLEYAQAAGTLGVKGSANLLRFSETLAKLETASDITGEEGAKAIARLLDITDGGVENVQAFGDSIVKLGNNVAATENEILQNSTRIAQATSLYKVGHQEVLAYGAATRALGLQSEVVGSSFARTFGAIENSIRTNKNIEKFAAVTGKSVQQLKDDFGKNASGVFNDFIKGLNGVSNAGGSVQGVLESLSITSTEDQRVISTLAGKYEDLEEALKLARNAGGAMTQEFETANQKLENVGKKIGVAWDNLVLSIENGQGVFATVGSYLGNEFAGFLVATKKVIDETAIGFKVFGQFLDDYKPKMAEAGRQNIEYADSLSTIKEFLENMSMRKFVYTFAVGIPNAFREAGANVAILKNIIVRFIEFLNTATPAMSQAFKDALNPFKDADTSVIKTLFSNFEEKVKASNKAIVADTERANQEAIRLYKERYDKANELHQDAEDELKDRNTNGAVAAAIDAEIAAEQAVNAATKGKTKVVEEAARRANDAARRATAEAGRANEEVKEEADAAAQRASEAASRANDALSQVRQANEARIASQRAMQARIDEINQEAQRTEKNQHETEIQQVKDKYARIRQEINKFYKDPKNAGSKVDASGLDASERKERENVDAKHQVEALKVTIAAQKQLYNEFEQYKTEFGAQMAQERFKGDLSQYENYVAYLQSLLPKPDDESALAVKTRDAVEAEIAKAQKAGRDKEFDENARNFTRIINQTIDANTQRLQIEEKYFEDLALLEKEYAGTGNAEKLAIEKAELDERKRLALEANREIAFQEGDFYKKVMEDVSHFTREEIRQRIKDIKKLLQDPSLTPVERAMGESALQEAEDLENASKKSIQHAEKFQEYAGLASSSFSQMASAVQGMNPELAKVFNQLSDIANIAGSAAGAIAGFASGTPQGFIQGVQGAVSAITGIISLFDQSEKKAQKAEEQRQYAQELQIRSIEAATKALERQLAAIEEIYGVERLQAYGKALDEIKAKIEDQAGSLSGKYILTGDAEKDKLLAQINSGVDLSKSLAFPPGFIDGLTKSATTLESLIQGVVSGNQESIEALQQLLDQGLLDEATAAMVEDLLGNIELAKEALRAMQEEATGLNFDAAVDGLLSLFEQGKTAAADFGKFFDDILQETILNAFKRNILEKAMQPFYDMLYEASSDGTLTPEELAALDKLGNEIGIGVKEEFEQYKALLEGLNMENALPEENQDTLTGAIRGQLTEETGGKLAGIYQGMFGQNKQMLMTLESMNIGQQVVAMSMGDLLDVARTNVLYSVRIEQNTRYTYEGVNRMEVTLNTIAKNTKPGMSARDMGLDGG